MRKFRIFKVAPGVLAAAMLALGIVAAAPVALAEGIEISAAAAVGFGQHTAADETSSMDGTGEASVTFESEKGDFSGKIEIGIADTADSLDTAEHEIVWAASESLSITISGFAFGIGSTDGNISITSAPGPVGDEEANFDYSDAGLLNIEYKMGAMTVGLGISDGCVPTCGYGGDDGAGTELNPDSASMTSVVHMRGKAGSLGYNMYLANSSGTFANAESGAGSGMGLGVAYESGGMTIGFDYSSATVTCNASAGAGSACADDRAESKYGVAFSMAGFGFHYFAQTDTTGATSEETTNIDVVYLIEAGDAKWGPEYRTKTNPDDTTETFIVFGMAMDF